MTDYQRSLLTDEEIRSRMPFYESKESDPADRAWHAEGLVAYCRGSVAETAVRTIVVGLPEPELERLVSTHVVARATPTPDTTYCRHPKTVAQKLADDGFTVREGNGWRVGWAGGETLEGDDLCRIALLIVWLRRMRETDPGFTPAY